MEISRILRLVESSKFLRRRIDISRNPRLIDFSLGLGRYIIKHSYLKYGAVNRSLRLF